MINRKYYPGEQFIISAVLVGGDFGTTIGTVHANFVIVLHGANPQDSRLWLKSTAEYSQTISNSTHCSELTFTLIGNDTQPYNMMYLTAQHLDPASAFRDFPTTRSSAKYQMELAISYGIVTCGSVYQTLLMLNTVSMVAPSIIV